MVDDVDVVDIDVIADADGDSKENVSMLFSDVVGVVSEIKWDRKSDGDIAILEIVDNVAEFIGAVTERGLRLRGIFNVTEL